MIRAPRDCWLAGVLDAAITLDAEWWVVRYAHVADADLVSEIAALVAIDAPAHTLAGGEVLTSDELNTRIGDWARGYADVAARAVVRARGGR